MVYEDRVNEIGRDIICRQEGRALYYVPSFKTLLLRTTTSIRLLGYYTN